MPGLHDCSCRLVDVACDLVRQLTRQQFVEDDTKRVDVAPDVQCKRIREHLLRTHIRERSHELADVGLPCCMRVAVGDPGNAKIKTLRLSALVHEDVAGFQIAMNDAALVRVVNGIADLGHQLQPLPDGQRLGRGVGEERLATDKFHGEVRLWAGPTISGGGFVNLRDAGVLESTKRQRFLFEAAKQLTADKAGFDHLQGDGAARLLLFRLEHGSHAAFTENSDDAIVTQCRGAPGGSPASARSRRRGGIQGRRLLRWWKVSGAAIGVGHASPLGLEEPSHTLHVLLASVMTKHA